MSTHEFTDHVLPEPSPPTQLRLTARVGLGIVALLLLALIPLLHATDLFIDNTPPAWDPPLRTPLNQFQTWLIGNRNSHPIFLYFFEPLSDLIDFTLRWLEGVLLALPWPAHLLLIFAIGYRAGGVRLAIGASSGLLLIGLFGLWREGIATLALLSVSVFLSLLIGIPVGIWAARSERFDRVLRPLLDAMQTMPAFVYLIPVLLFFGIARVPSVIATVIYALPPAIRLTTLGLRQVDPRTLEAADAFGTTSWQRLFKVQLPLALPSLLLAVNQTIMMALGIVVIAALIGAGGLGWAVLDALRRLRVGQALEAGLAIVILAVIFDRIMAGFSQASQRQLRQPAAPGHGRVWGPKVRFWGMILLAVLVLIGAAPALEIVREFPTNWHLSIRGPVDAAVKWMAVNLYEIGGLPIGTGPLSDSLVRWLLNPLRTLFQTTIPWPLMIAGFAWLGWSAGGWRLALGSALGIWLLGGLGLWAHSMDTLSQVLVAVVLTLVVGVPMGVLAARSDWVESLLRPVLDFLQTIPPFVYLVPVIMLFNVGRVPGIIASVLYALPPVIRLTNVGIRQVAASATEVADAFGATGWQKLIKVQLPLALPSLMMGVNQAMMMVLAMAVIAGLVGGGALGLEAVNGLTRSDLGRGIEAGLAIVILAIVLDRISQRWGTRTG